MIKLEIVNGEPNPEKWKFNYVVKGEGFEAKLVVYNCKVGRAFVMHHFCSKGGELLWTADFWEYLQSETLKFHYKQVKQ